ncbi:MAG TPA: YihY/virulence factor BrkB family protein [Pyrinomonadaceae bacterium]
MSNSNSHKPRPPQRRESEERNDWRNRSRIKHLLWRINEDDVFGRAAQLSYYFLLALFPLLLVLINFLGYLAQEGTELRNKLLVYLAAVMPSSAVVLVHTTLDEISTARGGGKISLGILAALWAASNGMGAVSQTLNSAYNVVETRSWWKVRLVSVLLTLALAVLIIAALAIVLNGGSIGDALAGNYGLSTVFTTIWSILQWPIALIFVLATFNLIYNFAPNISSHQRRWFPPGAFVAVGLWVLISFAFRLYLHYFDSYSVTYGSLGAVIILMLWFYLTGVAILIGGEVNCEVDEKCNWDLKKAAADDV